MSEALKIPHSDDKSSFRTLSWFMSHVMLAAAVITLCSAIFPTLSLSSGFDLSVNGNPFFGEDQIPNTTLRAVGITTFAIVALVQAWGFYSLRRTFQQAAQNAVFSEASVQGFRRFAYAMLFVIFAQGFSDGLMEGIADYISQGEEGSFHMEMQFPKFTEVLNALLLLFVAHAFVIGARVQGENDAFL